MFLIANTFPFLVHYFKKTDRKDEDDTASDASNSAVQGGRGRGGRGRGKGGTSRGAGGKMKRKREELSTEETSSSGSSLDSEDGGSRRGKWIYDDQGKKDVENDFQGTAVETKIVESVAKKELLVHVGDTITPNPEKDEKGKRVKRDSLTSLLSQAMDETPLLPTTAPVDEFMAMGSMFMDACHSFIYPSLSISHISLFHLSIHLSYLSVHLSIHLSYISLPSLYPSLSPSIYSICSFILLYILL